MHNILKDFNRNVSLEKLKTHCLNDKITIQETSSLTFSDDGNSWKSSILWGDENIRALTIVKFNTLAVLALATEVFQGTNDANLFEDAKDFIKEYCNFYAGYLKGTLNNEELDVKISLPIMSESFSIDACYGGDTDNLSRDKWLLTEGHNFIQIESYMKISENFDPNKLNFLEKKTEKQNEASTEEGNIEFF